MSVSLTSLVANSVVIETMTDRQVQVAFRQGKAFREETARRMDENKSCGNVLRERGVVPALRSCGVLSLCLECGTTVTTDAYRRGEAARVRDQRDYAENMPHALECCGTVFLP